MTKSNLKINNLDFVNYLPDYMAAEWIQRRTLEYL